jgi:putative ABC transport system substrate-binding protein
MILIGSAVALSLLRVPDAEAQEPGRIYRLGILTGVARQAQRMVAFFDELKLFGFVDGQNLKLVVDGFDLRDDQLADVAATLAKAAPDVVLCVGDLAIRAARQYTVPIVALSPDMVAAGFVRSLVKVFRGAKPEDF